MTDWPRKVHKWPGFSASDLEQLQFTESEGMWRWRLPVIRLAYRVILGVVCAVPGVYTVGMTLASLGALRVVGSLVYMGIAACFLWSGYAWSMGEVREVCLDGKSREVRITYGNLRRVRVKSFPADLGAELLWYRDHDVNEEADLHIMILPVVGGCVPILAQQAGRELTDEDREAKETDKEREAREKVEAIWAELRHEAGYVGEDANVPQRVPPPSGNSTQQTTHSDT